jgi:hypothetical protein
MRHLFVGLTILTLPWAYSASAFIPIFNLVDQAIWAWVMIVVGALCLLGAVTKNQDLSRAGMVGSAIVTSVLAMGLTLGVINTWIIFGHNIGSENLIQLILDHPSVFPAEMAKRFIAPPSPFLPLLLLSVSVKDFTMCAQPLRVPLEDRIRVVSLRES